MEVELPPILITGGAGFIGCRLAHELVDSGTEVVVLDSPARPGPFGAGTTPALPEEVTLWPVDVTEPGAWDAAFKLVRPSAVVHLAAETGTGQSLRHGSRHSRVNVVGTTDSSTPSPGSDTSPSTSCFPPPGPSTGRGMGGRRRALLPPRALPSATDRRAVGPQGPLGRRRTPRPSVAERPGPNRPACTAPPSWPKSTYSGPGRGDRGAR